MVSIPPRGAFVTIEGIDGAGTTTQARLLVDWLNERGCTAHLTWEPSTGPVGLLLRDILARRTREIDPAAVALLFAADRVDHVRHEVEPHLARGEHVVSDRYVYSSLAYQSQQQDLQWVAAINHLAPDPDLTVYLRTDPELARQRRARRGSAEEIFERDELQQQIAAKYDELLGSSSAAGSWGLDPTGSGWIRQDPTGSRPPLPWRPAAAILDGALAVDTLQSQLRTLVQKVALARGTCKAGSGQ